MGRKTIDLPDGSRYVGEVDEDGVPHGQGVLSWPGGVRVEGEWRDGLRHGQGALTAPDGTSLEVAYRNDEPINAGAGEAATRRR